MSDSRSRLDIPEPDWQVLRKLREVALERFCERALQECESIIADSQRTAHERYLTLYKRIEKRDNELGRAFNDLHRSNAIERVVAMRMLGVVTDEEMEAFSPPTREVLDFLMGRGR